MQPSAFTQREQELMSQLREHRDVVLSQVRLMRQHYKGRNEAGKAKLENLVSALERICDQKN
jgi:hypothetical protein